MTDGRRRIILLLALMAVAAVAAVASIRNYDFFWHLATGRWIVEHRALPLTDPFAIASERIPWINGEWLYQVLIYGIHEVIGLRGLSFLRGALAVLIFWIACRRLGPSNETLLFFSSIAFAGAMPTFDVRPSSVAMLFLVIALRTESATGHAINSVIWMNMHPSALLAPLVAALRTRRVAPAVASGLALLVNPFGIHGILAPIRLTSFVSSGQFVNAEWLPSPIGVFPLLYFAIALSALAFVSAESKREHWWRIALLALFAFLAVRHVRHQGLFFAAFPILAAPMVLRRMPRAVAYAVATMAMLLVLISTDHRIGIAPERFPAQAVARLRATGLPGNIYNADQFGGYLENAFYPERRTLTDGRNELFREYIPELVRARRDQRAWLALLEKYRIDLAVEEYGKPLQVTDAVTKQTTSMAASLAFWPRDKWALIAFDRAGMVFARRAAFSREAIGKWEIRDVVPDAPR